MERIFPESDQEWTPEMIGLENSSQWIEIADEKLYIHTQYGLYHCTWENDFLSCEKYEIDLGPNLITVEYWVDEEGGIQVSQNSVTLEVGQYLNVRPRTPEDSRPSLYDGNGVLEMKADYFYAAQVGDNFVIIGHYGPSRTVEIMVIDPERSS